MPVTKEARTRHEILDACLRRSSKKWDKDTLLEAVNEQLADRGIGSIGRSTLYSDIDHLRNELHAPIATKKDGRKSYYAYEDPNFSILNLPVSTEDVNYLKEAVDVLKQVVGYGISDEVDEIIAKLEHSATGPEDIASRYLVQFEGHTQAQGGQYINELLPAVRGKTAIYITYKPFGDSEAGTFLFHPYMLKQYRSRWFLIGRKDDLKQSTTVALDRIQKLKPATAVFIENDLFDPQTIFNGVVGVTIPADGQIEPVQIKVYGKQCHYILTKPIHHSQKVVSHDRTGDGCMEIRLQVMDNYELRALLMSYGADIEVLAPANLRDKMAEMFAAGHVRYASDVSG